MDFQEAINTIVEQFKATVKYLIGKADFDKTYSGYIKSVDSNKFSVVVIVNGGEHTITNVTGYNIGDMVKVCLPRNDWKNAYINNASNDIMIYNLTIAFNTNLYAIKVRNQVMMTLSLNNSQIMNGTVLLKVIPEALIPKSNTSDLAIVKMDNGSYDTVSITIYSDGNIGFSNSTVNSKNMVCKAFMTYTTA